MEETAASLVGGSASGEAVLPRAGGRYYLRVEPEAEARA